MPTPADLVDCGAGVMLDLGTGVLRSADTAVELTRNELRILQTLLARRGRTVPREDLMTALWATDCFVDENTLTVNVARLRQEAGGGGPAGVRPHPQGGGVSGTMRRLCSYLYTQRRALIAWAVTAGLFWAVAALYALPHRALRLCGGALGGGAGGYCWRRAGPAGAAAAGPPTP